MTECSTAPEGGRLLRVALTGGIATGKSYVLARLNDCGVPTIDADQLARDVVRPGRPAWTALVARFGPEICHADGRVDRARLGAIVFADAAARADLEAIVHPPVREAIADWFDARGAEPEASFAVADIPLLYETGRGEAFDRVVVTACRPETQQRRVVARDALSAEAARRRIAAQLPIDYKVARADFVVWTDGTFEETDRQVDAIGSALRRGEASAAARLRP